MKISNKKAFSVVEYTLLFVIVILAFSVMRSYIQRGVFGLWGQSGQSFAFGRQYDPQRTVECGFDELSNTWYDHSCFESNKNLFCTDGSPCNGNQCANGSACGCNNVPLAFCADGSACGSGGPDLCTNGSTCGENSCEEGIMQSPVCKTVSCGQMD